MSSQGVWMKILRVIMGKTNAFKICGWAIPVKEVKANPHTQTLLLQTGYLKCRYCSRDLPLWKPKFEEITSLRTNFELQSNVCTWQICLLWTGNSIVSAVLISGIYFHVCYINRHIYIVCIAKKTKLLQPTSLLFIWCRKKEKKMWNCDELSVGYAGLSVAAQILILFHFFQWLVKFILLPWLLSENFSVLSCNMFRLWCSFFLKRLDSYGLHINICVIMDQDIIVKAK